MAERNRLHRSELAVPAINTRMLEKAPALGADMVFLDLEDAVAPDDKAQARRNTIEALNDLDWSGCSVSVRINGPDTHYCYRDIVKVGIMPSHIYSSGRVGVVSRSGTLNYEAVEQMTTVGLGQSTCIGIGGDPVNGTDFLTVLRVFSEDPDTDAVVLIGEIGGPQEVEAARWARENLDKPLIGFIAGVSAPAGRRMGHAGAIISGESDTAEAKMARMEDLGVHVVRNPAHIGKTVLRVMSGV